MLPDFEIRVKGKYESHLAALGLTHFQELIAYIQDLPYGRTASRSDFATLFTETKGTCSLKHGLLAELAAMNGQGEIHLMVGIFLMNAEYAPKIGAVLQRNGLENIPEAHCYLRFDNQRYDFTHKNSSASRFEPYLVREQRCEPGQLSEWKPMIHKHYLEAWIKRKNLTYTVDQLWEIRENCIREMEK